MVLTIIIIGSHQITANASNGNVGNGNTKPQLRETHTFQASPRS